ncbi:MAG: O-antigen ligase family protein [Patescibacteria group bacterium]
MFRNVLLAVTVGFAIACLVYISKKCEKKHLNLLSLLIVGFYPFEYLPSLFIAGTRMKINYILAIVAIVVLISLAYKQKIVLNKLQYWGLFILPCLGFFGMTSVISWSRFINTFVGLFLCSFVCFFIANFNEKIEKSIKILCFSIIATNFFGLYQFFGDLVNIPTRFTFLRDMYTKKVFTIPRIHSTANEPQLYAGMLFLPLSIICLSYLSRNGYFFNSSKRIIFEVFTIIVFILTFSKGAFLSLFLGLLFVIIILFLNKKLHLSKNVIKNSLMFVLIISALLSNLDSISSRFQPVINNLIETLDGKAPTIVERSNFLEQSLNILRDTFIFGIGPGQFGPFLDEPQLIVNNVYLEVWLEYGLMGLVTFIIFLGVLFKKTYNEMFMSFYSLVLFLTLILICIQWVFFSPIYIMPFWIIFGLILSNKNNLELNINS